MCATIIQGKVQGVVGGGENPFSPRPLFLLLTSGGKGTFCVVHRKRRHDTCQICLDKHATIFSVSKLFPIIAQVNIHAQQFYRHATSPYFRSHNYDAPSHRARNYFKFHTTIPYYRSHRHANKLLSSSFNSTFLPIIAHTIALIVEIDTGRKDYPRWTFSYRREFTL